MSEESTEQRPLLCEDLSEEERFPELPRRYRHNYRGRAKLSAKGATAIITRWPSYWSSSLRYWWIGLSMFVVVFFIIYNTIIAFILLPSAHTKPAPLQAVDKIDFNTPSYLPEVFMHFIVNSDDNANLDKILPYIETISEKNLDFTFNVILLFNNSGLKTHSAEENNDIALNSLWSNQRFEKQKQSPYKNIKIKQVDLSLFMDESPIMAKWQHVPAHLISFLVKAISIWDKGGIAINPKILTPRTPNALYMEKLQHILHKFKNQRDILPKDPKTKKFVKKHNEKLSKVNNIRDIINILEHEDNAKINYNNQFSQENLTAAESAKMPIVLHNDPTYPATLHKSKNRSKPWFPTIIELPKIPLFSTLNNTSADKPYHVANIKHHGDVDLLDVVNESFGRLDDNSETRFGLLPFFLDLLFHDKQTEIEPRTHQEETNNHVKYKNKYTTKDKSKRNVSGLSNHNDTKTESLKPMIIPAKGIIPEPLLKSSSLIAKDNSREIYPEELTIDLRGNILATTTSCHAFIGTLFNNAIHHPPGDSLQDFIISELSLFCKGLLSSCRGIDVLLL